MSSPDMHQPSTAPDVPTGLWRRLPPSGRLFVRFWGGASLLALLGAIGLQEWAALHRDRLTVAPRAQPVVAQNAASNAPPPAPPPTATPEKASSSPAEAPETPPASPFNAPPGTIPVALPQANMLEPVAGEPGHNLPKRGPNGELPRKVYAAAVPAVPPGNARIAILLDGFGLSDDLSREAVQDLPSSVSFAIPAYAPAKTSLFDGAHELGHEIFLSLPMQPSTAPLDDEGPKALGYDHSSKADQDNLNWSLSRFDGYVGVTNAFSGLDGDAYAQSPDFSMVAQTLDQRGLLYLNATPGAQRIGPVMGGDATLSMDTNADSTGIDGQLAHLVELAKKNGTAIAIAGPMRPVLLQRLEEWTHTLAGRGITLVPVSSLCNRTSNGALSTEGHPVTPVGPVPTPVKDTPSPASHHGSAVTATPLPPPDATPASP
ncbi:divergent polysaccharide deacetylase family protein [Acetobacter estunensis]|uniref:divergent polysaccharide deacetylase family protein n=1 Tax=Acetobacter estunensis TaxID=104097 RepID=UPI001C2CCE8B|nr:divergent polysaccharide deacetylase family protein [Acetobacter estunensis]